MLASVYSKNAKTLTMRLSFATTILFTLSNKLMSLISIDQFPQFVEQYPEMEQFYDLTPRYDFDTKYAFGEDIIGDTCTD
jgi:hypothetical protein